MDFNSFHQLQVTGQSQSRRNLIPQNIPGNMTSPSRPVTSSPQNFQQGGHVNIQGSMTSTGLVNVRRMMPQNARGSMTSSAPPNPVNFSPQNFQQGGIREMPQNTQGNMTSCRPQINPSHHRNFQQGGRQMPQNTQGNMTSSVPPNSNQQIFQQVSQSGNSESSSPAPVPNSEPYPINGGFVGFYKTAMNTAQGAMVHQNLIRPCVQQVSQPQSVMQRNQIVRPRFEQVSQPVVDQLQQQEPENSGSESVDLIYEKIVCMREKYLPELNVMAEELSDRMQKEPPENEQRRKQYQYCKEKLEFLVRVLRMEKSDVGSDFLGKLDSVERQINHIFEYQKKRRESSSSSSSSVKPIATAPKPQLPQPVEIVNLDDDDDEVDEASKVSSPPPQLPQARIAIVGSDHQPMNLEVEVHGDDDHVNAPASEVSSPQPQLCQTQTVDVGSDHDHPMNHEVEVHGDDEDISTWPSAEYEVSSPEPPWPQSPIFIDVSDDDDEVMNLENEYAVSSPQTQTVDLEVAHGVDVAPVEESSNVLTPFERLRKAVESMPRASLRAAVGGIGEAVRMMDSVDGCYYPEDGYCRAAYGPDYVATTFSGTKRMRLHMT